MADRPSGYLGYREVIYPVEHWILLKKFREEAIQVMEALESRQLETVVHGSIARGDVDQKSDIDVFIPRQVSSFMVETALEEADLGVRRRLVVQATPAYSMKAYVEIGDDITV
ncbi:MAG: nucleotidyltransferase, partial [Candidatus Korarchaeota archaeon]|nr:nucleotidyltransferase [Candidatus Korarchaeota archaeon]